MAILIIAGIILFILGFIAAIFLCLWYIGKMIIEFINNSHY